VTVLKRPIWTKAINQSADPKRARHALGLLEATTAREALKNYSAEEARILVTVLAGSQALGTLLISKPAWLSELKPERLRFARRPEGLWAEVSPWFELMLQSCDFETALSRLRVFQQCQMLRIGARDLIQPGSATAIAQEISDVADVCLESVWRICFSRLAEKFGAPFHQNTNGQWQTTAGCLLGLGKLGGRELNYSSDVDVIFVYEEEGSVVPRTKAGEPRLGNRSSTASKRTLSSATMTNHQFFNRLAESIVAELTRLAPEGTLYRIDLRLRPEGNAGPLTRSLAGYENYYAQWGQTWERMMLIKTRRVAGDQRLANEFLEMVQPFRYPRSVNENVLSEVAAMKTRIENEVVKEGELETNVKLGRGGIREIEFVAQVFQLLHAGRQPFLQSPQTILGLQKLAQYQLLASEEAESLSKAYVFLRDVEHRLQMENNRQIHTIPPDRPAQERLARLLGFSGTKSFSGAHRRYAQQVRDVFDKVLKTEISQSTKGAEFPSDFQGHEQEWKDRLARHGFKDIAKAFRVLREFVEGPGYVHVSPRTRNLSVQLLPRLFERCLPGPKRAGMLGNKVTVEDRGKTSACLSDPDRVVTRLDSFISAYGARATLFELWNSNPALFDLLVLLFDRSEFLAELAIRTPDLVDELVISGRLRQRKSAADTLRDLRHGLGDADQHRWLRRYHQAELMRIGLRDILGLSDPEQNLNELSALADACLRYALELLCKNNRLKHPPFAIIGLGKLGGQEIDYGSDLDIIFVASEGGSMTKLAKSAVSIMEILSARTADGLVFLTDARLRPDGEKGLLVNTISNYEKYYRQRAQLWEIQSLTRTRAIEGDARVGQKFQQMTATLTDFSHPARPLAAYSANWKETIHRMRLRIQNERTPRGKDALAIKTGIGGLMDAEFIAQGLCLENGWQEPNTLKALQRAEQTKKIGSADELIEHYRTLRRVEGILRRWSYEGETVLPEDEAAFTRVSIRCGLESANVFREKLAVSRQAIREVYLSYFEPRPKK
jgi:[glutamine synthetase] adenylyltransferase / [glutamine synthetase]-adenylyl-L-tyrosine phosphorylase